MHLTLQPGSRPQEAGDKFIEDLAVFQEFWIRKIPRAQLVIQTGRRDPSQMSSISAEFGSLAQEDSLGAPGATGPWATIQF